MEKKFEDVLNSNLNLQSMLQSVLSSITPTNAEDDLQLKCTGNNKVEEPIGSVPDINISGIGNPSGLGSSERWWNKMCKSSDEEEEKDNQERGIQRVVTMSKSNEQVSYGGPSLIQDDVI